jgi:hypothetical protein
MEEVKSCWSKTVTTGPQDHEIRASDGTIKRSVLYPSLSTLIYYLYHAVLVPNVALYKPAPVHTVATVTAVHGDMYVRIHGNTSVVACGLS